MGWSNWGDWGEWGEWSNVPRTMGELYTRYGEYTEIITGIGIQIPKAEWFSTTRMWVYDCGFQSVGKVQLQPGAPQYNNWGSHISTLEIRKMDSTDDGFNFGFNNMVSDENELYGAYPHDGDNSDFQTVMGVLGWLTYVAITKMNSYVSFGFTAAELIAQLCGAPDSLDRYQDEQSAEFNYYPPYSPESGCWYNWTIGAYPDAYISFTLDYLFYGLEMLPRQAYGVGLIAHFYIQAPSEGPEEMTTADKEKYGIIEIDAESIEKKASEYGLSNSIVKEHIQSKKPLYIMTKPEVEIKLSKIEKTKVLSKEEIEVIKERAKEM